MSGWPIPQPTGGGGGGGGTVTIGVSEILYGLTISNAPDTLFAAASGTADVANIPFGYGLRFIDVVFPPGSTGNVTINSVGRFGAATTQLYTNPGGGGGTVAGTVLHGKVTSATRTATAGSVAWQMSTRIGVAHAPVASFDDVFSNLTGGHPAISSSDLTAGWFDVGTVDSNEIRMVRYTIAVTAA